MEVDVPAFFEVIEANKKLEHNAKLVLPDGSIPVQREFLTLISPVFGAMFSQQTAESKTGKVVITDMTYNAVKLALDFCAGKYLDAESAVDLVGVYTFADKYDITAVRQKLEKYFDTALTLENFLAVTMFAYQYSKDALFDKCAEYLARDSDVALLPGFQELDKDLIKAVLAKASTFKKADVAAAPVHEDWTCRECFLEPIIGHRFTCLICRGYTLCQSCEKKGLHAHHALVRTVTDDFAVPDVYESINWVLGETS